jgi:FdhD protein
VIDERSASALQFDGQEAGGAFAVTASRPVWRISAGGRAQAREWLAEEVPVALVYNGISHVVMLATPCDLEDFATGFSLTEGIVDSLDEIRSCEVVPVCNGIEVQVELASRAFAGLKHQRRQLAGRTGCGICGAESIERAVRPVAQLAARPKVPLAHVNAALQALDDAQQIRNDTGATHAAGWVDADGQLRLCREDVGRHNALDKLTGAMERQGITTSGGFALISSRASYEMVQKAARAGIGALVAVSAPTALAVRVAEDAGVALACWARGDRLTAYTHPEAFVA